MEVVWLKKRIGDFEFNDADMDIIEGVTNEFQDKTEDEIFVEIINLNDQMEKDLSFEEYEAIFEQLDMIRHLLSDDQISKLDKLLKQMGR